MRVIDICVWLLWTIHSCSLIWADFNTLSSRSFSSFFLKVYTFFLCLSSSCTAPWTLEENGSSCTSGSPQTGFTGELGSCLGLLWAGHRGEKGIWLEGIVCFAWTWSIPLVLLLISAINSICSTYLAVQLSLCLYVLSDKMWCLVQRSTSFW